MLSELDAPKLDGPAKAEVTLVGWGSTKGVLLEAREILKFRGVETNQLQVKYLLPFHTKEVTDILKGSKRIISVEVNFTGQFARYLRAETGISVHNQVLRYDGEPFEPLYIVEQIEAILAGRPRVLDVSEDEVRDMAYHYSRVYLGDQARPGRVEKKSGENGEAVWSVEVLNRGSGAKQGDLKIGVETGSIYSWEAV